MNFVPVNTHLTISQKELSPIAMERAIRSDILIQYQLWRARFPGMEPICEFRAFSSRWTVLELAEKLTMIYDEITLTPLVFSCGKLRPQAVECFEGLLKTVMKDSLWGTLAALGDEYPPELDSFPPQVELIPLSMEEQNGDAENDFCAKQLAELSSCCASTLSLPLPCADPQKLLSEPWVKGLSRFFSRGTLYVFRDTGKAFALTLD